MAFKKVTAIVRNDCVGKVETGMDELNVSGMSVVKGKGHGGYATTVPQDRHSREGGNPGIVTHISINNLLDTRLRGYDVIRILIFHVQPSLDIRQTARQRSLLIFWHVFVGQ